MVRVVDKEKIARADRESRIILDMERDERTAKTQRLREQRLQMQAKLPVAPGRKAASILTKKRT